MVRLEAFPANAAEHPGDVPVGLSTSQIVCRDQLLEQVLLERPACFGRLLRCDNEAVSKGLQLLSQLFFIVEEVRVDKGVVVAVHGGEMTAIQRLTRAASGLANEAPETA